MKNKEQTLSKFIGFGMLAGVLVGIFLDNVGLWISMGLALGAALGYAKTEKMNDGED
jgi:hypothetical protein